MQCQAGARGCQGWRSEERIGEGLALLGLEAGGHRGKGGCEAECGGSVKAEGGQEEVGSAKGAVGTSQCQLGAGGGWARGGSSHPILSPGLVLFCKKNRYPCW